MSILEQRAEVVAATATSEVVRWPRGWLMRRALLAADLIGLASAFTITEALWGGAAHRRAFGLTGEIGLFLLTLPVWIVLAKIYGLYDRDETRTDHRTTDDLSGVFHLTTVGTWLVFVSARLLGVAGVDLNRVVVFWALSIGAIVSARSVARAICRRHPSYVQNTLVVGSGDEGQMIGRKLVENPQFGLRVVGYVLPESAASGPGVVGTVEQLPGLVRQLNVGRVIVVSGENSSRDVLDQIRELNALGTQVDVLPRYHELLGPEVDVHLAGGLPIWSLRPFGMSLSSLAIKRSFDVAIAGTMLLVLAPWLAIIALLIKLDSRGPAFFGQLRIGERQRTFRMWKFRTMVANAESRKRELVHLNIHAQNGGDARMFKVVDDPRVTRVGGFLRRFSLDELPQLVNVLVGDMSLVGPRPLIPDEHSHVEGWQSRRLDLKPGITGLWQVNGRSALSFDEMVTLDYRYVTNWSLGRDVELILRTIPQVVRGSTTAL